MKWLFILILLGSMTMPSQADPVWSGWRKSDAPKADKPPELTWRKRLIMRGIKERENQ